MISEVRKDEKIVQDEGCYKAPDSLKKTRYILMSSRETLRLKDLEAVEGKVLSNWGTLF